MESLDGAPDRRALVRDGAARGRRAVLRVARDAGVRGGFRRVQLDAERTGVHPVARTCFRPPPNVDSALVAFRRTRPWGSELEPLKRLVQAAFAHRRKTLANSLELTGLADRERAAALSPRSAARPTSAPRRCRPRNFPPRRAARHERRAHVAAAKINLALVVGPRREDGLHEVATVLQRVDVCDRLELGPGARSRSRASDDTIVGSALRRLADGPAWTPPGRSASQGDPGRGGARRGECRRRGRPATRQRLAAGPVRPERLLRGRGASARTCPSSSPGPEAGRGRRRTADASRAAAGLLGGARAPARLEKPSTGAVYARFDELGGGPGSPRARRRFSTRSPGCAAPAISPRSPPTTSRRPRARLSWRKSFARRGRFGPT